MREGFWAGLIVGIILTFIAGLFVVWGGNSKGLSSRIEENKETLSKAIGRVASLERENDFNTANDIATVEGMLNTRLRVLELEERLTREENRNWFGE